MPKSDLCQNPGTISRREFTLATAQALALGAVTTTLPASAQETAPALSPRQFRLWATSDAHVGTDLKRKRESLAEAIAHSEGRGPGPGFEWDMAVHLGDFSGNQGAPNDEEGAEVVRQFGALQRHRREQF